jgi:hypothetical protein
MGGELTRGGICVPAGTRRPYPPFRGNVPTAMYVVSKWGYMLLRAVVYPQGHPPTQECGNLLEIEHGIRYNVTHRLRDFAHVRVHPLPYKWDITP